MAASRILNIMTDSFLDGISGAALFGKLRRPGAPTALFDICSPEGAISKSTPNRVTKETHQFHLFDADYIENLRSGDIQTQEHFVTYFSGMLQHKLRTRFQSQQTIEEIRQETFIRVLSVLRTNDGLRQPERLGAFVNTVCNKVLFDHYRLSARSQSTPKENQAEVSATGFDNMSIMAANQIRDKVRANILKLPKRDRLLLKAVFLDEKDRDEVCREFGVDREYLRVLLSDAKKEFKAEYEKRYSTLEMIQPSEEVLEVEEVREVLHMLPERDRTLTSAIFLYAQ
jgi:RNA polymerase sigma-70 factor (ECF subfamily)